MAICQVNAMINGARSSCSARQTQPLEREAAMPKIKSSPFSSRVKDLTGLKFGRLTVIEFSHLAMPPQQNAYWRCLCFCGTTTTASANSLNSGHTASCGCLRKGPTNGNWKGGKTVSSHGYVLVRVGVDHHLAHITGYAYEHRVKAEKKIGRRLQSGEIVHHKDGNKQNNSLDNLEVLGGIAEHFYEHRSDKSKERLRKPGETNPTIQCACGCGRRLKRFDTSNRPRVYISGHNPMKSPAQDAVLEAIGAESVNAKTIAGRCRKARTIISATLTKLKKKGLVRQVSRGIWQCA